ncbi:UNVERIFIED_CONTAM: hypothetical protein FKN15_034656 [Acipenser sinensis]
MVPTRFRTSTELDLNQCRPVVKYTELVLNRPDTAPVPALYRAVPRFYPCETCKTSLPMEDKHGMCASCLGPEHAKEALVNRSFGKFCAPFSKRMLEKRLSRSSEERSASLLLLSALPHQPLLQRWLHPHPMALRPGK